MSKPHKYNWKELQPKLAKGPVFPIGRPFHYKHQLRVKSTPEALAYTYWVDDTCAHSNCLRGVEEKTWEQLFMELGEKKLLHLPCVGVGISVWNDQNILMRPEAHRDLALEVINRALRTKPETIRKDLLSTGVYGYTAMSLDSAKDVIFGVPLGYPVKEAVGRFPCTWAVAAWSGPLAFPFFKIGQARTQETQIACHTALTKRVAVSLLIQGGDMKYLQQDRLLVDSQEISAASVSKFRLLFNLFSPEKISHFLYPVDVNLSWTTGLTTCLRNYHWTVATEIVPPEKLKFPNIPTDLLLQDMFPTQLPWIP